MGKGCENSLLKKQLFQTYFLQLSSYILYVSGVTLSNINYGRKKSSYRNCSQLLLNLFNSIHIGGVQICVPLSLISCCLRKINHYSVLDQFVSLISQFVSKKVLENVDGKRAFQTCHQNGSQTRKNFAYSKVTALVLISIVAFI